MKIKLPSTFSAIRPSASRPRPQNVASVGGKIHRRLIQGFKNFFGGCFKSSSVSQTEMNNKTNSNEAGSTTGRNRVGGSDGSEPSTGSNQDASMMSSVSLCDCSQVKQSSNGPVEDAAQEEEEEFVSNERFIDLRKIKSFGGEWLGNFLSTIFYITILLGEGGESKVYFSRCVKANRNYAVKKIERKGLSCCDMKRVEREVKDHMKMNSHGHVIKYYGAFIDKNYIYIFQEFANQCDLYTKMIGNTHMEEPETSTIIKQIVMGVDHYHNEGVIHRDLKPSNIMLHSDDGINEDVKIIDFGLSSRLGNCNLVKGFCGTPGYQAPEMLDDRPIGPPADLYAVGVIFYNLFFNGFPYDAGNALERERAIHFPEYRSVSAEAKDLMRGLLHHNPKLRYTAVDVFNHPFITREALGAKPSSLR